MKALQGHNARWRLRVGDFRVVYTVEDGQLIVWVLSVGNRRDVYRACELGEGARPTGERPRRVRG
ncbi:type II toxin-antitoxin system RelE family toxin [Streptomyces sp. L7]